MICLRCGLCCINLSIAIVDPESVLPDGTIDTDWQDPFILKPAGEICPHLVFQDDAADKGTDAYEAAYGGIHEATCAIHHLACYQETSCLQYEQFGPDDSVCMMSGYFKSYFPSCRPGQG